ncbi:MAG: hypothetical protein HQM09_13085 [Candidatus Riflebacteria bacterium]|nr:hypothetical protein [Candidatus Riflebacteria bacterium]
MAVNISAYSQMIVKRNISSYSASIELEALKTSKSETSGKASDIGNDLIQLSPFSQILGAIEKLRRSTSEADKLDVMIPEAGGSGSTLSTGTRSDTSSESSGSMLEQKFDLMLRMIATDSKDYERLRARFHDLMELANGSMSAGGKYSPVVSLQASKPALPADAKLDAQPSTQAEAAAPPAADGGNQTEAPTTPPADSAKSGQANMNIQVEHIDSRLDISNVQLDSTRQSQQTLQTNQSLETQRQQGKKIDPLVIDLKGNGLDLTSVDKGALFDMNADGRPEKVGWVKGDDALLVLDRNGNGKIDNGTEVFGDQNGAANGFAELAKYDDNHDGVIDSKDRIFKALKLYRDINGNGSIDSGELTGLSQAGIERLSLSFKRIAESAGQHTIALKGGFTRTDGSSGEVSDVLLAYKDTSGH